MRTARVMDGLLVCVLLLQIRVTDIISPCKVTGMIEARSSSVTIAKGRKSPLARKGASEKGDTAEGRTSFLTNVPGVHENILHTAATKWRAIMAKLGFS